MLAFAVLWPLSFVLSPRALHSTNVFLIKLTVSRARLVPMLLVREAYNVFSTYFQSLPQLIVIGIYERFLARGQKWRQAGSSRAHNLYTSLSRSVKHMPLLDFLGSSTMDVHEAIFDVDFQGDDEDLFADEHNGDGLDQLHDFPAPEAFMRGSKSHESLSQRHRSPLRPSGSHTPPPLEDQIRRTTSMSLSPRKSQRSRTPRRSAAVTPVGGLSPTSSPRPRGAALPTINPPSAGEVPSMGPRSPLGALFGSRRERVASVVGMEAGVKRMEAMVEEMKRMPVNKLKDEMKELQVRSVLSSLVAVVDDVDGGLDGFAGTAGEDREPIDDADARDAERYWASFDYTA